MVGDDLAVAHNVKSVHVPVGAGADVAIERRHTVLRLVRRRGLGRKEHRGRHKDK